MGEREHESTNREEPGRGETPSKGLPSRGDVYPQEKIPVSDTRGDASLTPDTALKTRKKAKKTPDSTPQAPSTPNEFQEKLNEQQAKYEELLRENERMSAEIERLRAENEVFKAKEENRRQQVKDAQARLRNKDPEAYRKYERERKRLRRAELKRQAQSSDQ